MVLWALRTVLPGSPKGAEPSCQPAARCSGTFHIARSTPSTLTISQVVSTTGTSTPMMGMTIRVGGNPSGIGVGVTAGSLVSPGIGEGCSGASASNSGRRDGEDGSVGGGMDVGETGTGRLEVSLKARLSLLLKYGISREPAIVPPATSNIKPPQVSIVATRLRGLSGSD